MNIQIHGSAAAPDTKLLLADVSARLERGEDLSRAESSALLHALLEPSTNDQDIAAILTALANKGETSHELTGMAEAMRARMVPLRCDHPKVVDTAGTGASKAKTFNVSTAAAFVIAAAGLPIAKHGARAATSNSGSADVLQALGIPITATPSASENSLAQHGICFLFAPQYHPAAARVAPIRRQLGFRTVFNLIGPLSSPSRAKFQVIGVSHPDLQLRMAEALVALGCTRGWVVHGEDSLDEVSLAAPTQVVEVRDGKLRTFKVSPESFGIASADCSHLRAANADESAAQTMAVLENRGDRCATDLVILNAAAALVIGLDLDFKDASALARTSIVSGAARAKLEAARTSLQEPSA